MDYQEKRKQALWSEISYLNKWDDEADQSEQALKRQRRETGERLVREKKQQSWKFRRELAKYDLEQVQIFGVAGGTPVQEVEPAKKAKCRSRHDRQLINEARKSIRERSQEEKSDTSRLQEIVDGTGCQLQKRLEKSMSEREKMMASYGMQQDSADYDVMKYFYDIDLGILKDYSSNDYKKRKVHIQYMTDQLMKQNVDADYFEPENLKEHGWEVQALIMRYKAFRKVYADPINKPYFDKLSNMEKQLIQTRILDMADLYENVFRYQCRSLGVNADNGQFVKNDAELEAGPEELKAVHSFKERIQNRNEQTRQIMLDNYEELLDRSKILKANQEAKKKDIETGGLTELQGTGLTGYLAGYGPEELHKIRTLFLDNEEEYKANRPLLSLMEQEFFRVMDARGDYARKALGNTHAPEDVHRKGESWTEAEKEFVKLLSRDPDAIAMKTRIITNRLEALKEAMEAIAHGKKPKSRSARKVLSEFRQKLDDRNEAVLAQIDETTAGWAERRLKPIEKEEWKIHERYDGTRDLAEYDDYLTGKDGFEYTGQLQRIGLRPMLEAEREAGRFQDMNHVVRTRAGVVKGLNVSRMIPNVEILTVTAGLSVEQGREMLSKLAAGDGTEEMDRGVAEGLMEYKNAIYRHLKGMEAKYGKMLTQLHPEDVLRRINVHQFIMDGRLLQDMVQLIDDNKTGIQLFTEDAGNENYAADKEYKELANYYFDAVFAINTYIQMHGQCKPDQNPGEGIIASNRSTVDMLLEKARKTEKNVHQGPALRSSQVPYYAQSVRERYQNDQHPLKNQLYGRW